MKEDQRSSRKRVWLLSRHELPFDVCLSYVRLHDSLVVRTQVLNLLLSSSVLAFTVEWMEYLHDMSGRQLKNLFPLSVSHEFEVALTSLIEEIWYHYSLLLSSLGSRLTRTLGSGILILNIRNTNRKVFPKQHVYSHPWSFSMDLECNKSSCSLCFLVSISLCSLPEYAAFRYSTEHFVLFLFYFSCVIAFLNALNASFSGPLDLGKG